MIFFFDLCKVLLIMLALLPDHSYEKYLPPLLLAQSLILFFFLITGTRFSLAHLSYLSIQMDMFDSNLKSPKPQIPRNNLDDDDIFSSSVNLEESHINEGYKDGYKDGLTLGKQDGYEVGLKHGFESGEELGFYRGLVDVWTSVIRVEPSYFSARIQKSIHQIEELLENYPLMDHEDESKDDILKELRLKFRAINATLGVKLEYKGYPKMSDAQDY
ncbi:uncharacterized protein LOC130806636 [Amaranthus tricolor]|uniref:uncharacterized protein LOC130806636 n=1 Tax=Amaranthus tricolor TaxID=29722 RepID=UPI00258E2D84|nr:uncharacterized protein LOC130806636 [Amaranthus tricolor]